MALKIATIDHTGVVGTLDGSLPFSVQFHDDVIVAKIANWTKSRPQPRLKSVGDYRNAAYEALARYREEAKHLIAPHAPSRAY